jgi:hypothetical protein
LFSETQIIDVFLTDKEKKACDQWLNDLTEDDLARLKEDIANGS